MRNEDEMKTVISNGIVLLAGIVGMVFLGLTVTQIFKHRFSFEIANSYLTALTCVAVICIAVQAKRSTAGPR